MPSSSSALGGRGVKIQKQASIEAETFEARETHITLIEPRGFERESFELAIRAMYPDIRFNSASGIETVTIDPDVSQTLLVSVGVCGTDIDRMYEYISDIVDSAANKPVVILGVGASIREASTAIKAGAKAYITTSIGFDRIMDAVDLAVASGGCIMPRHALLEHPEEIESSEQMHTGFSSRQFAVAEELRKGSANKRIARELDISESTVKVHVRTIMGKLSARNRTEAALALNRILEPSAVDLNKDLGKRKQGSSTTRERSVNADGLSAKSK